MKRGCSLVFIFLLVIISFVSATNSSLPSSVGEIQLVYEDDSQTTDSVILGNLQIWLTESGFKSSIIKNSEITNADMKDKLTVFVYNKKAVVIYGEISTTALQIEAGNIYTHLQGDSSVEEVCDIISNNEYSSDDLKDYLCDNQNEFSKQVGEIQLVYDDNSQTIDSVILGNLQTWLNGEGFKSIIKKNSDVDYNFMKDKLTVFVYNRTAIVVYGESSTTSGQVEAGNIYSHLFEETSVVKVCDIVSSNEYSSDDLKDYLCGDEDELDSETPFSKAVGVIQLVYDDNSETMDSIILGNLQMWLNEEGFKSEIRKNSDINHDDMKDKVIVFVYYKKAVVIYGEISTTALQIEAGNIYLHLKEDSSVEKVCDLISSNEYSSNDLKDYLCSDETESELEVIFPVDDPVQITESDKKYICRGCELEDNCYPFGYRKDGKFCSDTREFIGQNDKDVSCENNFECKSNVCVSGECISEGFMKKIINWFKRLFGGE